MKRAWPCVLFGALTLAAFWKFIFLGQTLYDTKLLRSHLGLPVEEFTERGDTVLLLPMHLRIYNEGLKAGELRLWNPYLFCGYPTYADPMVHPFAPPRLLLHALLPPGTAYNLGLLLHFFFSGVTMAWALRAMGRSKPAATAGGVLWMLCGYNTTWFSTEILSGAMVFGPLALGCLQQALDRKDPRRGALAGAAMGMVILESHAQHAVHLFLLFLAWLVAAAARDREGRRLTILTGAVFALSATGAGLAAILTRLDTIAHGLRLTGEDMNLVYTHPFALLTHVGDLALGKLNVPIDSLVRSEFPIFLGLAGTSLAVAGAVRAWREPTPRFVAIFAAVALLVAFVKPLAQALQLIPILNLSLPSRWLFVFAFCASVLAARGMDAIAERAGRAPHVVAGAAAALLVLGILLLFRPVRLFSQGGLETMLGFGLAIAAAYTARRWLRVAGILCAAAILIDLVPPFLRLNAFADARILDEPLEAVRVARQRLEPWRGAGSLRVPSAESPRGDVWTGSVGNNLLALYGVETPAGYEAIIPAHYLLFAGAAGGELGGSGRVLAITDYQSPLLDAINLRYLFLPFDLQPPERFKRVRDWGILRLYENSSTMPRAYLVSRVLGARNEDQALRLLRSPAFNPRESVILETTDPLPPLGGAPEGRVEWVERLPHRLALRVSAREPAILVLSETDYPGWEAEVDGRPVPIYRANVAFRAVAAPPGEHVVRFVFRPDSARTGLIGSGIFFLLAIGYALRKKVQS